MTEIIMLMFENNLELGLINDDIITIETHDNLYNETNLIYYFLTINYKRFLKLITFYLT